MVSTRSARCTDLGSIDDGTSPIRTLCHVATTGRSLRDRPNYTCAQIRGRPLLPSSKRESLHLLRVGCQFRKCRRANILWLYCCRLVLAFGILVDCRTRNTVGNTRLSLPRRDNLRPLARGPQSDSSQWVCRQSCGYFPPRQRACTWCYLEFHGESTV